VPERDQSLPPYWLHLEIVGVEKGSMDAKRKGTKNEHRSMILLEAINVARSWGSVLQRRIGDVYGPF
jgi:hypothetical protein